MKWIKLLLWLIVIGLLVTLVYQNLEYFNSTVALNIDLKINDAWQWQIPEFQTGYYMLICFLAGLILTGLKALGIKFRLKKQIKKQDEKIDQLKDQVNELKTELEVFKQDPYIKKALSEDTDKSVLKSQPQEDQQAVPAQETTDNEKTQADLKDAE